MPRLLRYLAPLLVFAALPLAAQSADDVIDHAVKSWSKVKTARASFDQSLTNSLTGSSLQSHGEFQQQRPSKLAIVFDGPDGGRVIDDGRSLWIYLPSSAPGQVIRRADSDGGDAQPMDLSSQFLEEPHARFRIALAGKAQVDGMPATALTLVPKYAGAAPFTRAKVWVCDADGLIRQFETEEASGVTRRVRLTSLTINGPVDRTAFTFTPPKGVKVVAQ